MKHQALLLVIFCMALSLVLGGCSVEVEEEEEEESFLTVKNNSNVAIWRIFIAAADGGSWSSDQLGSDTVQPGSAVTFAIDPGTYDVKVVSEYSQESVYPDVAISNGETITVNVKFR